MTGTWHADDALLAGYVAGDAGPVDGASLEQHLLRCPDCRARIATHLPSAPLDLVWTRIRQQAEAPAPTAVQRVLLRLRMPESDALLVAAAPSLRSSWLFGLLACLGFVALAAKFAGDLGLAFFLLVAPLVPVVGVALAYGPDVDPAYEVALAAPYPAARLVLLRTATVLTTSLPLVVGASLLVQGLGRMAFAWLLPALAFSLLVLAASTRFRPVQVGGVLALGWAGAVMTAVIVRDATAVLEPGLLVGYTAVGIAAALVLRLRLHSPTPPGSLP
jgi:Putative zinc-finger